MQKALTQMNVQLANVISDLSGVTGQRIVRAILAGERDPAKLADLRDWRIRATHEEVAKSLEGNWQKELLFALKQEVTMYDTYQERIAECDQALRTHLKSIQDKEPCEPPAVEPPPDREATKARKPKRRTRTGGHVPQFDLGSELHRITGVDLTRIDSVDVMVAQTIISEVGLDMSRWKTEANPTFAVRASFPGGAGQKSFACNAGFRKWPE